MSDDQVQFGQVGTTFQISAYSSITFNDGLSPDFSGDFNVNEIPDDPTQAYLGNAIGWDYNFEVTDGTNTFTIAVFDHDANGNGQFDLGAEQGIFLAFIGGIPPLNTELTFGALGAGAFDDPTITLPETDFVPCFTSGTQLLSRDSTKSIEELKSGDQLLRCPDMEDTSEFATLLRIFRRRLSPVDLAANPKLRPIRIMAGSLGKGLPKDDLLVSRQHRMLVQSKIAERMFGQTEVLISAIKLTELPGIFVDNNVDSVEYYHLLFDKHEVIYAEGAPTESLFTGHEALNAISHEAREEILTIFPEISEQGYSPKPARFIPPGKLQKKLVARHSVNNKSLLQ